ncbi:MAG TPA: TIGR03118 family protein [Trebonia sp.]|nr:TIGR03118 family protein [Trebonia sp.]
MHQVNLASDVPGLAPLLDPDLKNPWGAALTPTSPLWVANQGTRTSTVYSLAAGVSKAAKSKKLRITLPGTPVGPAGLVANPSKGFVLRNGKAKAPAAFIFATLDGHIEAWSPRVSPHLGNADDVVTVHGAAYTGLAIAATAHGEELFAADFGQGTIDVFNSAFRRVKLAARQFTDGRLPKGYLPFNTQALGGRIFVTYDKIDPVTHREAVGRGIGVVDEFGTDGHLITRIAAGGGALNAPWGLAIAPKAWANVAGGLLIGNFGDGRINVFARQGARFAGHATGTTLLTSTGKPFAEPGLWALVPGTAATGGTDAIWFTAGINGEQDGLLGVLRK